MKKLLAVVLALLCVFSPVAVGESAVFFVQETPTSLVGNETLNNVIQLCRAGYEAGVLPISSIIDRCVGLVDPSKR